MPATQTLAEESLTERIRSVEVALPCPDLDAELRFFTGRLGFKVELIFPADSPSTAVISGHGLTLRLERARKREAGGAIRLRLLCDMAGLPAGAARGWTSPGGTRIEIAEAEIPLALPPIRQEFLITRLRDESDWGLGRAGMQYRDLIPGRLGGRFVASHIRIPQGGPVPDYVHYHRIRFQMIYCRAGWVRVVYEDQGAPFLLAAGDCVLQPPEIRHRVLEASPGLEVIEIGSPAVHETRADHGLALPTGIHRPSRDFGGQRFQRHIAAEARWRPWRLAGFEVRDTGIGEATGGLAGVRVVRRIPSRIDPSGQLHAHRYAHGGELLFLFVLAGILDLDTDGKGGHRLAANDSCVLPAGLGHAIGGDSGLEFLEVTLPAVPPASKDA
jgi:quercetin dioxygenase-like cupin family protein